MRRSQLSIGGLLLLVGLSVAMPASGRRAGDVDLELSGKDLVGEPGRIELPGRWRYSGSTDPWLANPKTDHSDWPVVDARFRGGPPDDWSGVGWFRLRVDVDQGLADRPLALEIEQWGAIEIYLDGERLVEIGVVSAEPGGWEPRVRRSPVVFSFRGEGSHLLAVRYAQHDPKLVPRAAAEPGFRLAVAEANERLEAVLHDTSTLAAYQAFFTGVFGAFALLHLLLFAFYPQAEENLWFALLAGFVAAFVFLFLQAFFAEDLRFFAHHDRAKGLVRLALAVFALRFVYALFRPKPPRLFWLALLGVGGLAAWTWVAPVAAERATAGCLVLASLELVRTVVVALARGRAGARIVGIGVITLAFGFWIGLLGHVGVIRTSLLTTFLVPFSCIVLLMVTMSIHLSYSFARTRRELERKLTEVERLSEQKLEQERRFREDEVARAVLEAEFQRQVSELEGARRLQLSMLPEELPKVPGVELAAAMHTAAEVGGDYYDFEVAADGALTLAIGDATGHGLLAGTIVTATKSLFKALAAEPDLSQALVRCTDALGRMNLRRLRMALTLGRFHEGRLVLAAAGMPPPLVHRWASDEIERLDLEGMPLGGVANYPYREVGVDLDPGDTVLLMSDGFPERLNSSSEMLGYEAVADAFARIAVASPAAIIERLVADGDAWAGGTPLADDVTFVVLRRLRGDGSSHGGI